MSNEVIFTRQLIELNKEWQLLTATQRCAYVLLKKLEELQPFSVVTKDYTKAYEAAQVVVDLINNRVENGCDAGDSRAHAETVLAEEQKNA